MDFHSLVASNLPLHHRPTQMDARAEERYYGDRPTFPRPRLGTLVSIATAAGVILLLTGLGKV